MPGKSERDVDRDINYGIPDKEAKRFGMPCVEQDA
jgi:hypothetical protein